MVTFDRRSLRTRALAVILVLAALHAPFLAWLLLGVIWLTTNPIRVTWR